MRVLYDLWAAQPLSGKYHGGGTHALAILDRLIELRQTECISAYFNSSRWLDPKVSDALQHAGIPVIDVGNISELQALVDSGQFDVLYSSLPYDLYRLDMRGIELVATVHGLRHLEMPTDTYELVYHRGRRRLKSLLRRFGRPLYTRLQHDRFRRLLHCNARRLTIVVPSRHTKHSLLNAFPNLESNLVTVAYSPLREPTGGISDDETTTVLAELGISPRAYFLLINGDRWIKNAYRALTAIDAFFTIRPEAGLSVVCLGVEEGGTLDRRLRNRERFRFRGYVPEETLEALYRHAFALVYPSLNEGFGYPPLEAMRWGTPVICSAVTSLPEICDSAALYCNPLQVEEIQNRISQLVLEPDLWDLYARRGRERAAEVAALQRRGLDEICRLVLGH